MTAKDQKKWSIEELTGCLIFCAVGLFFLLQAQQAETNQDDLIGPSLVPTIICVLLIGLGLVTGIRALFFYKADPAEDTGQAFSLQTCLKLAAITVLGFVYVWAFTAFGYLFSTFAVFFIILYIFGIRNIYHLVAYSITGSLLYYLVFVKVMKIYDPPGNLINFQSLLPF